MPTLVRMQEKHRDAGLEIVGLNTDDETLEQVNEFVADMKLNYTIAWSDTKLQAALVNISKFPGIPQSFVIDRDGNLRGVFRGAAREHVAQMEKLVDMIVTGQETPAPESGEAPPTENKTESEVPASDSKQEKGKADTKGKK